MATTTPSTAYSRDLGDELRRLNVFVQDPGAIVRARLLFDRLAEVALDAEQSRSKLAEYAGRPREDLDDAGACMA